MWLARIGERVGCLHSPFASAAFGQPHLTRPPAVRELKGGVRRGVLRVGEESDFLEPGVQGHPVTRRIAQRSEGGDERGYRLLAGGGGGQNRGSSRGSCVGHHPFAVSPAAHAMQLYSRVGGLVTR